MCPGCCRQVSRRPIFSKGRAVNTTKFEISKGIGRVSGAIHREMRSALRFWGTLGICAVLAACGGGGGGGGNTAAAPPAQNNTVLGSTTITQVIATAAANTAQITVTTAPAPAGVVVANVPFVSVTVCVPGTTNCTTVDHVQVDTGSSGFRVLASALTGLPGGVSALTATVPPGGAAGSELGECMQFADGIAFGGVRQADVSIGSEKASSLNIEVIGDSASPQPSSAGTSSNSTVQSQLNLCASPGTQDTAQTLHANGVLGVGTSPTDCIFCAAGQNVSPMYYTCTGSTCSNIAGTPLSTSLQVQNPVSKLPVDNNGVIVELPAVPATGAATAIGMLVFGIGTQTNNALGNAQVFTTDNVGNVKTVFNGTTLTDSFFDSGSNSMFFPSSIATCADATDFYCPTSVQSLSAMVEGTNGINATLNFSVGNTDTLTASGNLAFNNQAGSSATFFSGNQTFDWGLPAFYGRNMYTAISGASTPGGAGPYYAF